MTNDVMSATMAANMFPEVLAALCRDNDAKCPLLALGTTSPQDKCPFTNLDCAKVSAETWKTYIERNLKRIEKAIAEHVVPAGGLHA